jgi:glycosyltransferase involved in cell wall biosynthesis
VNNVGTELPHALASEVNLTYFPILAFEKDRLARRLSIYRDLIAGKFDIIHFNITPNWFDPTWVLFELTKATHSKTVLSVHGFIPLELQFNPAKRLILDNVALTHSRNVYQFVDKIVVNSHYMLRNIVGYYGIASEKIKVIPNGVDPNRFLTHEKRVRLIGHPSILYFGGLSERKGVDVLLRAIAKTKLVLPSIKLHLVGSGDFSDHLRILSMREEIEKDVIFWGHADRSLVPQYYNAADICIFPSRYEPFGIVILEALASGRPVIASNVGGIPEFISSGENGILVEPNDPEALSRAIILLFQDKTLMKSLRANALKTAALYSWKNIARKYLHLYRHLANS